MSLHPTTTTALTNHQEWPTQILPEALQSNNLHCNNETPTSAQKLILCGQLNNIDFLESNPEIQQTLMEAFIEDDYDGKLHLTTLTMTNNGNTERDEVVVGISFWREVSSGEMNDWMDMHRISKAISQRSLADYDDHSSADISMSKRMRLVRSNSLSWIDTAMKPCSNPPSSSYATTTSTIASQSTTHNLLQRLTHSWIKIELIAIKQSYRSHHLGNILLGCTLAKAHALHHNEHAILHIAGGSFKNVAAAKLYARYGFVSVPKHEKGGPFVKPDRDLYVLGNIGNVVNNTLPWAELLQDGSTK